jgi:hypothetical protein
MLGGLILDFIFGIERRLRERQIEIEAAHTKKAAEARQALLEELLTSERLRNRDDGGGL